MIVCYCVRGLMSKCIAENLTEEKACFFSHKSQVANRCMHRIEALDNHCDCAEAQRYAQRAAERPDDLSEPEEELDLISIVEDMDLEEAIISCSKCFKWSVCHAGRQKWSEEDMQKIASTCNAYREQREWEKMQDLSY